MTGEKPRLLMLQDEIDASKGAAIDGYLRLLDEAFYAADINHRELVSGVQKVTSPETALDLSLLKNRGKLQRVSLEIARLLQNYLDAADSLLDRINDLVKDTMPEMESDWDERRRQAEREPALAFIRELRAYVHHSRQPGMTSTFNVERTGENGLAFSAMVSISRKRLEPVRNWGKRARRFLESRPQDAIPLDSLAGDTFPVVCEVVQWTAGKIKETYRDALADLKALHEKYNAEYEKTFGSVDASD